jgi:mannosyltransferase
MWPALATLAIAFLRINGPQLGTDELVTSDVGHRSMGQILAMLHNVDAVHATYYFLMHGWMAVFGDSETAMRMPSALAMSGTAALVALIGRRLFGPRAGMCGGLLFALIPVVSRFAQEARSYALVVLAATLATFLLLRALDMPRRWWRWAGYALCVAAVGLLHLVALTVLAGHCVAVVLRARQEGRVLWCFCLAALAGAAGVIPVVVLGTSQASRQLFWVPEPDVWGLADLWPQLFASGLCAGVVITLAAMAWKERRDALLLCFTVAVLPPFVLWAASHGDVSYFRFQYAMFTVPAWTVLAGAGLARATRSWLTVAVALTVVGLLVLPDQRRMRGEFEHDVPHNADYMAAARTIEKYYHPGDAAVYVKGAPWMLDQGVRYYLRPGLKLREVFVAVSAAENSELYPVYCPAPAACLRGENRIWVVVPGNDPDPLNSVPVNQARVLRAKYTTYGTVPLSGLTVVLLERKR